MAAEEEEYWGYDAPAPIYEDTELHKRISVSQVAQALHTLAWQNVQNLIEDQYKKEFQSVLQTLDKLPTVFMHFHIDMAPLLEVLTRLQTYIFPEDTEIARFSTHFTKKENNFYIQEIYKAFEQYFTYLNSPPAFEHFPIESEQQKALQKLQAIEARIQKEYVLPYVRITPIYQEDEKAQKQEFFIFWDKQIRSHKMPQAHRNYFDTLKNLILSDLKFIDFSASTYCLTQFSQTEYGVAQNFPVSHNMRQNFPQTQFSSYTNIEAHYFQGQKSFSAQTMPYISRKKRHIARFFALISKYTNYSGYSGPKNKTKKIKFPAPHKVVVPKLTPVEQELFNFSQYQKTIDHMLSQQDITTEQAQRFTDIFDKIKMILTQNDIYQNLSAQQRHDIHNNYLNICQKLSQQCAKDIKNFKLTGKKDLAIEEAFTHIEENIQDMFYHKMSQDHKETAVLVEYLKARKR